MGFNTQNVQVEQARTVTHTHTRQNPIHFLHSQAQIRWWTPVTVLRAPLVCGLIPLNSAALDVCFYGANHVLVQGSPVASILLWLLEGHAVFPHPASPHAQPTHLPYHSQHRRRGHSTPGGRRGPGSQGARCDQQGLVGLESLVGRGCQFCSRLEVLHKTGRQNV